jgi:hypothetical protein
MNWLRQKLLRWLNLPDIRFYSRTDLPGKFSLVRKECEACEGRGDRFVRYETPALETCWRCQGVGLVWDIDREDSHPL